MSWPLNSQVLRQERSHIAHLLNGVVKARRKLLLSAPMGRSPLTFLHPSRAGAHNEGHAVRAPLSQRLINLPTQWLHHMPGQCVVARALLHGGKAQIGQLYVRRQAAQWQLAPWRVLVRPRQAVRVLRCPQPATQALKVITQRTAS